MLKEDFGLYLLRHLKQKFATKGFQMFLYFVDWDKVKAQGSALKVNRCMACSKVCSVEFPGKLVSLPHCNTNHTGEAVACFRLPFVIPECPICHICFGPKARDQYSVAQHILKDHEYELHSMPEPQVTKAGLNSVLSNLPKEECIVVKDAPAKMIQETMDSEYIALLEYRKGRGRPGEGHPLVAVADMEVFSSAYNIAMSPKVAMEITDSPLKKGGVVYNFSGTALETDFSRVLLEKLVTKNLPTPESVVSRCRI